MKRKSPELLRSRKQLALIERVAIIMGVEYEQADALLRTPLKQSVRVNPLMNSVYDTLTKMHTIGWQGTPVEWCSNGYTIENGYEELRDGDLVTDGRIYVQNASSWLPVTALDPQPGDRILDMCAAPGGKTSHIAAMTMNDVELVANDNSRPRLAKLRANMQRLGATAEYTLYDATKIVKYMQEASFDKILLDAPCSGEGLINLDHPKTLDSWSVAHIRRLATLQKQLIGQAWQLLKPGGVLVYSTCTMAPEEDEAVIDWLLRRHDDADILPLSIQQKGAHVKRWNDRYFDTRLAGAVRVFPADGSEAFFVCKVKKGILKEF